MIFGVSPGSVEIAQCKQVNGRDITALLVTLRFALTIYPASHSTLCFAAKHYENS